MIEELAVLQNNDLKTKSLLTISDGEVDKLLKDLKGALSSNRIKKISPIVEKIEKFDLKDKQELFDNINYLIENRKFKNASELIGE